MSCVCDGGVECAIRNAFPKNVRACRDDGISEGEDLRVILEMEVRIIL